MAGLEGAAAARPASLLWWMTFERQGWTRLVGLLASEESSHDLVRVDFLGFQDFSPKGKVGDLEESGFRKVTRRKN